VVRKLTHVGKSGAEQVKWDKTFLPTLFIPTNKHVDKIFTILKPIY